jgi:hypothetical protein
MKIQDLEQRIADRASEIVRQKIKVFKTEIDTALKKLFTNSGIGGIETFGCYGLSEKDHRAKDKDLVVARAKLAVLRLAIRDHDEKSSHMKLAWPDAIWQLEVEAIRTELLSKMDLMQQLLMSNPKPDDDGIVFEGDSVE